MKELQDLYDRLPDIQHKEVVKNMLKFAYWRGVEHHRTDPKHVENRRLELLKQELCKNI